MNPNDTSDATSELKEIKRRLADYALIFELMGGFSDALSESEAVSRLFDVIVQLTAAGNVMYLPMNGDSQELISMRPLERPGEVEAELLSAKEEMLLGDDGFIIRIGSADHPIGVLRIDAIPMSERIGHYVDVVMLVAKVFSLAASNARAFDMLRTSKKEIAAESERLSITLSSIGDGVIATDNQARITMMNPIAEALTGWTQQEAGGRPVDDVFVIVNEYTGKKTKNPIHQAITEGKIVELANHTALIARDGRHTSIADSCAPIRDASGAILGAILVFRDVSSDKAAEDALKASEQRFRSITATASDTIICADSSGRVVFWNEAATRTFGFEVDEVLGKSLTTIMPERFRSPHKQGLQGVLARGDKPLRRTVELVGRHKEGHEFPIELSLAEWSGGDQAYFTGIIRDISDRVATQEQLASEREDLREQRERYRTLFHQSPYGVLLIDLETALPVEFNDIACSQLGYSREEFSKLRISDYEAAEKPQDIIRRHQMIKKTGRNVFESKHRTKKGELRDVFVDIQLILVGGRGVLHTVIRDITEEKRAHKLAEALAEIDIDLHSTLDPQQKMSKVLSAALAVLRAERVDIALREDDGWRITYSAGGAGDRAGVWLQDDEVSVISKALLFSRDMITVGDVSSDPSLAGTYVEQQGLGAFIAAPLYSKGELIGALGVGYARPTAISAAERDFVSKLSTSAAFSIENASLYAAQQQIADTLQESVLKLPRQLNGLDFGHLYKSATQAAKVGGDFFDLFELDSGKIGVLIGDVSGKGIEAATVTSLVKTAIRAYAGLNESVVTVMERVNALVFKSTPPNIFVTVFFGVLDPATGALSYCSAGHPSPLITRRSGELELLEANSPIIGAFDGLPFGKGETVLLGGEKLILYTDGIIEARSGQDMFRESGLQEALRRLSDCPVKDIPEMIFREVLTFAGNNLKDDIAVLTVSIVE